MIKSSENPHVRVKIAKNEVKNKSEHKRKAKRSFELSAEQIIGTTQGGGAGQAKTIYIKTSKGHGRVTQIHDDEENVGAHLPRDTLVFGNISEGNVRQDVTRAKNSVITKRGEALIQRVAQKKLAKSIEKRKRKGEATNTTRLLEAYHKNGKLRTHISRGSFTSLEGTKHSEEKIKLIEELRSNSSMKSGRLQRRAGKR